MLKQTEGSRYIHKEYDYKIKKKKKMKRRFSDWFCSTFLLRENFRHQDSGEIVGFQSSSKHSASSEK